MENPQLIDALGHGASDKRIDILRAIARTGSISQAARDVAVSYKAAWQAVDTLTNLAGVPLVERAVGGVGGGGALLTQQGQHLLALADALEQARQQVQARWADGHVPGGPQAFAGLSRLSLRTSMRNQLPCTVVSMEVVGRIVRVVMQLGDDSSARMTARITTESAELLGLAVGMTVIALCKATAVRALPYAESPAAGVNSWEGRVTRLSRGPEVDEVAAQLDAGVQMVGFAPAGSGLRVRSRVKLQVDESAVVLALWD